MTLTFGSRLAVMLLGRFFWSVCRPATLTDSYLAILLSRLVVSQFPLPVEMSSVEQIGFQARYAGRITIKGAVHQAMPVWMG